MLLATRFCWMANVILAAKLNLIFTINVAGRCSHCHTKNSAATKERFCCSETSLPDSYSCAWCDTWGCRISCWNCWKAHQIQNWWVKDNEGNFMLYLRETKEIVASCFAAAFDIPLTTISFVRVYLSSNVNRKFVTADILGYQGSQWHRVQAWDVCWSLPQAFWERCRLWIPNYRGLRWCCYKLFPFLLVAQVIEILINLNLIYPMHEKQQICMRCFFNTLLGVGLDFWKNVVVFCKLPTAQAFCWEVCFLRCLLQLIYVLCVRLSNPECEIDWYLILSHN